MKKRSRFLSMITAVMMAASMLPAYGSQLAASASSSEKSTTNLTIDFNYGKDNNISTPEDTLKQLGAKSISSKGDMSQSEWEALYNQLKWKDADHWTVNHPEKGDIRALLTDKDSKYIRLTKDDYTTYAARTKWETIKITEDKVLDLNGHTFEIRYDRNRNNDMWNRYQNDFPDVHYCTAFEITNGATLTIIDSSEWRNRDTGQPRGTGRIAFTAYMIDPYKYEVKFNTTRDLFHVDDGSLVIYGGTFQAGRTKQQVKKNFSIEKLITTIGTAVELGVSVAEYATGLNVAVGEYEDELKAAAKKAALEADETNGKDDHKDEDPSTKKRDGTNLNASKDSDDKKAGPGGAEDRNSTIGEKAKMSNLFR